MKKKLFNLFISIGKYKEPVRIYKNRKMGSIEYTGQNIRNHYIRILFTKYPITGKQYSMLQGLEKTIFKEGKI